MLITQGLVAPCILHIVSNIWFILWCTSSKQSVRLWKLGEVIYLLGNEARATFYELLLFQFYANLLWDLDLLVQIFWVSCNGFSLFLFQERWLGGILIHASKEKEKKTSVGYSGSTDESMGREQANRIRVKAIRRVKIFFSFMPWKALMFIRVACPWKLFCLFLSRHATKHWSGPVVAALLFVCCCCHGSVPPFILCVGALLVLAS